MGLRSKLRKWIPKEIRDNPVLAIAAVALVGPAALGALGASTAAIAGATVAANTAAAIAIGTGVVTAGITYVQGGTVSDSLKAGVLSGAGSYAGSVVSNSVSNAVSNATGAPLGGGIGATVTPSGQFASTAGGTGFGAAGTTGFQTAANAGQILGVANPTFAGFLAGNVAGRSTEAAITGKPIEQAALFGAAQSIGFGLDRMPDFKTLPRPVQDVLVSSAQAAVMGQDVGDAVIESLIKSTNVVGNALKEIPGGIEFTEQNPIVAKYIVNTVSSALAAQLQGKEISDTVLESLVRTTASVLQEKFRDSQTAKDVSDAQAAYNEAQQLEQQTLAAQNKLNEYVQQNRTDVNNYNYYKDRYNYVYNDLYKRYDERATNALNSAQRMREDPFWVFYEGQFGRTIETYEQEAANNIAQRDVFIPDVNEAVAGLNSSYENLQKVNFFDTYNQLQSEFNDSNRRLTAKLQELQDFSTNLAQNSANLFTDFETELATTLAPLTAFEETDVTDQDLLAEISPVAPPTELAQGPSDIYSLVGQTMQPTVQEQISSRQQEIQRIEDQARQMSFADVQTAALPVPLMISVGGHAALGAYIWLSQKYNELFPDPEVARQALEQSPEAQKYERIIRVELQIEPQVRVEVNPKTQKQEVRVKIPDTPQKPLPPETKEFIERIDAQIETPSDAAKFNADNMFDALVKAFGESGAAGAGANDLEQVFQDLETEADLTQVQPTEFVPTPAELIGTPTPLPPLFDQQAAAQPSRVASASGLPESQIIAVPREDAELPLPIPAPDQFGPGPAGTIGGAAGTQTPVNLPPASPVTPTEGERETNEFGGDMGVAGPTEPGRVEDQVSVPGDEITDEELMDLIRESLTGTGAGGEEGEGEAEGEGPAAGEEGEGEGLADEGEGTGDALAEGGTEGIGAGEGVGGEGGEGGTPSDLPQPSPDIVPTVTTAPRRPTFRFTPGEGAPYRVTGMDESGILGRKQPLFGGDEDLQRAEWNRRSLRLRRLLGL